MSGRAKLAAGALSWALIAAGVLLFLLAPSARLLVPFFAIPAARTESPGRVMRVLMAVAIVVLLFLIAWFTERGGAFGLLAGRLSDEDYLSIARPSASTIAAIINPNYPAVKTQTQAVQEAAAHLGVKLVMLSASAEADIEPAFVSLVQQGAGALLVVQDPVFLSFIEKFVTLAARHAIPVIYSQRDYVTAGGLISYGPDFADGYRQAGVYVAKILKGEKPANLPVIEPTKFDLVVNLKTAKALGIDVPDKLLALADEVIE